MKQAKRNAVRGSSVPLKVSHAEDLPPCRFWIFKTGSSIESGPLDAVLAQTWEGAVDHVKYFLKTADSKASQRIREQEVAIVTSEKFRREWADFVLSVSNKGEMTRGSWPKLRSKAVKNWFGGFCRKWGMNTMFGWVPGVPASSQILSRQLIYRCENCGQRHYGEAESPWSDCGASCCAEPSLKPQKVRLTVEIPADASGNDWRALYKKIDEYLPDAYRFWEKFLQQRGLSIRPPSRLRGRPIKLWSKENARWTSGGVSPKTARSKFRGDIEAEMRSNFPKVHILVTKIGVEEVKNSPFLLSFLRRRLGMSRLRVGTHAKTISRYFTAAFSDQARDKRIEYYNFKWSVSKIIRYTSPKRQKKQ